MIVQMRTSYASEKGCCHPGDKIDLPEVEAKELLKAGYAELPKKEEPKPIETAVVDVESTTENATTRKGKPGKLDKKPNGV